MSLKWAMDHTVARNGYLYKIEPSQVMHFVSCTVTFIWVQHPYSMVYCNSDSMFGKKIVNKDLGKKEEFCVLLARLMSCLLMLNLCDHPVSVNLGFLKVNSNSFTSGSLAVGEVLELGSALKSLNYNYMFYLGNFNDP